MVKIDIDEIIDKLDGYMDSKELNDWDKVEVARGLLNNYLDELSDMNDDSADDDYDDIDQIDAGLSEETKRKAPTGRKIPVFEDDDEELDDDEPNIMPAKVKRPKAEVKGGINKKGK